MKRLILSFLAILAFSIAFSQKLFFVYLQSEPGQAFFVKLDEKVHSSTASGYLILSRLKDSSYAISVGFPGNKWPEQKFTIEVRGKDHGYTLKNSTDKGWGLYDIGSSAVQLATLNSNAGSRTEPKEVSAFTDILSKAANDPSLKEKPVVPKEEKSVAVKEEKPDVTDEKKTAAVTEDKPTIPKEDKIVVAPAVTKEEPKIPGDSGTAKQELPETKKEKQKEEEKEGEKTEAAEEYKPSVVTKKSESSTTDGLHLTFIDNYSNGKKDTIRITIPNQKTALSEVKQPAREEKKFLDLPADDSVKAGDTIKKTEPAPKVAKTDSLSAVTSAGKKDCASLATETDFLRIRKNMAAESNDEAMIAVAKKQFKTKCFSSKQIKNLGSLFLNDAGKYKFFDAAYESVADKENFSALASELADEYYINRFKAMLR